MGEQPYRRPDEPRSYEDIVVISPDLRRPRRHRGGEPPRLDAEPKQTHSPDGAGVKP